MSVQYDGIRCLHAGMFDRERGNLSLLAKVELAFDQSTTRAAETGAGLGLPISREIMAAHQGKIQPENQREGYGRLRFKVLLKHPTVGKT
ncbi:MAG: hypothetical protein OEZ68_13415 [Gammaproteobacteria bacterium]|nr:hypothetical protein [Gammaproteobacteria bacterium]MDH5801799.1 hypothetical protein [Gammaproteobacteria bacterium]